MGTEIFEARRRRLAGMADRSGLDGVVVVPGANLYYLTGLTMKSSERTAMAFIPVGRPLVVVTPLLEEEKVRRETGAGEVYAYADEDGPAGAVRSALASAFPAARAGRVCRLGLEHRTMRLFEFRLLQEAIPGLEAEDAGRLTTQLRVRKDPGEIELIEKAVAVVEEATRAGAEAARAGVTEAAVARAIEAAIRRDETATGGCMVASGPRSAMPHALTGDRVIGEGETVWADIVVERQGYLADITRTHVVGTLDGELDRAYEVVLAAQQLAREGIRPGMTGADVDALARDYIAQSGFGEYFTHRTGHGLGLEVHEEPYIVRGNREPLKPGMVFTVEPGIYLPGKGGVRVEDDLLLTEEGGRSLTTYPRDLRPSRRPPRS
jgi:Xaa-Pro aminopeptidase